MDALREIGVVKEPELAVVDHLVLLPLAQGLDGQPELLARLVHRVAEQVGDAGVDLLIYSGARSTYGVEHLADGSWSIQKPGAAAGQGHYLVSNVEVLTAGTRFDQETARKEGKPIQSTVVTLLVWDILSKPLIACFWRHARRQLSWGLFKLAVALRP